MENDANVVNGLAFLAFNIKREVYNVLDFFFSFLRKYEKKKVHNTISLMLDPSIKSLCIISSFIGREQGVNSSRLK